MTFNLPQIDPDDPRWTRRGAVHVPSGQGPTWWVSGDVYTTKVDAAATNGSLSLIEASVPPGAGPVAHLHNANDEAFYLLAGELEFLDGDHTFLAGPGDLPETRPVREELLQAPPMRILVADDNRDAADSLQRVLALFGHEVRVAYDGASAMRISGEFRPRVAILDIGMPGTDGYEVARSLRRQGGVTLVALTGWGQDADRRRAAEAGFDHHLIKPVDPQMLNSLLADAAKK